MSTIDQQFIEYIIKSIVSNPDDVVVERIVDERGVLLELNVNPEDLGRVIGKRGSGAQSLRTLLRALGIKNDARYNLKIIDDGDSQSTKTDNRETSERSSADEQATVSSVNAVDDDDDDEPTSTVSSRTEQTRKELEDLDDLDI